MQLTTRNVNRAFSDIFWRLHSGDYPVEQTRNGPAIVLPDLVVTKYMRPQERILFHGPRDANPIFHLMESIWILAGRKDTHFLSLFNSKIAQYSDDGIDFNAPYGYRLRSHFGFDQLKAVIKMLKEDPNTRRAVVQMWDPHDLLKISKDYACNLSIVFDCRRNKLNMTVFNRSNDLWWGAYGANAFHFGVLQEFVAYAVGLPIGVYYQVSNNLHLYTELYDANHLIESPPMVEDFDYYSRDLVKPFELFNPNMHFRKKVEAWETWLQEAELFCKDPFTVQKYTHRFFSEVAFPAAMVQHDRKFRKKDGLDWAYQIAGDDMRMAVLEWIDRREQAKAKK